VAVDALFLDPRTGQVVDTVTVGRTLPGLAFGSSVAVSPDRTKVAVTYGLGTVVLDTRTREELARITLRDGYGGPEPVWSSVWSMDGSRLLLAAAGNKMVGDPGEHGSVVLVDTATWAPKSQRLDIGGAAQTMEISPDGRWLALGMVVASVNDAPPGSVRILDARTRQLRRVLRLGYGEHPFDMSFSPDSRRIAVGSDQGTLSVFDVDSTTRLHDPARVHNDMVQQVEWLPDAETVVTSGADGMLSLYDADRGLVWTRLPGSSDGGTGYTYLTSVAAGKITALTGERPGSAYSLDLDRWLDYACAVAGRNLTHDEWSTYLLNRPYRVTCRDV
jgi:WD40 repeat protein